MPIFALISGVGFKLLCFCFNSLKVNNLFPIITTFSYLFFPIYQLFEKGGNLEVIKLNILL